MPRRGAPEPPDWRIRFRELEAEGRIGEAEQLILASVPHLGAYASVAQLYADWMRRLLAEGDSEGAGQARTKAIDAIYTFAGLATSGGEGAALSLERDEFLAALDHESGGALP
jgi:hypothetical protein